LIWLKYISSLRQICDLGFVSLIPAESCDNSSEMTSCLFQSDMIDNGLTNFSAFLNYVRKHIDRLTVQAGKKSRIEFSNFISIVFS
jgi:hypothetical protein